MELNKWLEGDEEVEICVRKGKYGERKRKGMKMEYIMRIWVKNGERVKDLEVY